MKKEQIKLAAILFTLGFAGVLSLLASDLLANLSKDQLELALQQFSLIGLKLLTLLSPTILLIGTTAMGIFTYSKAGLTVPTIEGLISKRTWKPVLILQLKSGVAGGILAGIAIVLTSLLFIPYLPNDFLALQEKSQLSPITRFLYGGITEEILVRFGLLSLMAWALGKVLRNHSNYSYWIAILISAIIFGLGHFPIVYTMVENPTTILMSYILIANMVGGVIFGWLYWKKGLEAAFIAHITTHVVMLVAELMS